MNDQTQLYKKATQLVGDLAEADQLRWDVEKILDAALGRNAEDGTGQGLAADVALVVRQRDEARAELQQLRQQETARRRNEEAGYLEHRDALVTALGQHTSMSSHTLMRLITDDVAPLAQSYSQIEAELLEWRSGQHTTDLHGLLDETLGAIRQLTTHLEADAQREQDRAELPTTGDTCMSGDLGGPDGDEPFPCHAPAAPSLKFCADHADGPVVETNVNEPLKFTHDTEE